VEEQNVCFFFFLSGGRDNATRYGKARYSMVARGNVSIDLCDASPYPRGGGVRYHLGG
jgi:hypothetical protein